MSQEQTRGDMEKIVARAIDDEDFRKRLGENPEATIESEGYVLTADEMAAIKQNVDPDLSQEQLEDRVSKAAMPGMVRPRQPSNPPPRYNPGTSRSRPSWGDGVIINPDTGLPYR